uniref:Uncharacterized protein n=1 Tax=Onchocerca volvulus TaxID=6282 RepID=A0A8R1TMS6_ONCVO
MNSLNITEKIYSGTTKQLLLNFTRSTISDVNEHQTLLLLHRQHSTSSFDSVPLIIEVIGIVTTVITCLVMHFIMKETYEDIDRPTTHHLIHHKYYSKQLNQLLNEQDRRKKKRHTAAKKSTE